MNSSTINNNEANAWGEHVSDQDGRKYWHNKVTKLSTYQKVKDMLISKTISIFLASSIITIILQI
jgi:hypothetical protein